MYTYIDIPKFFLSIIATHELIESSCDKLRPVIYENANNDYVDETITTGTTLFELYLALQQFSKLGLEIFNGKLYYVLHTFICTLTRLI